jgi:hypothetical protein
MVIQKAPISKQQFGKVDDIVTYVKEVASKNNIQPVEVDIVAAKVAVMDNVLTQAAKDLIGANVDCELKELLRNLNIYDAGLKTWTDLQKYISDKSNGKIVPEEMNRIAADIIAGIDPSISKIRGKILTYSKSYEKGSVLKQAITSTDKKAINKSGPWLKNICLESAGNLIPDADLAVMLSVISTTPGTLPEKFIEELAGFADDKFGAYLRGLDLNKNKIKSDYDAVLYLLRNRNHGQFTEESLFNALARQIACKDIPELSIKSQPVPVTKPDLLVLWIILGAGLIFFIFILLRRRKKDKSKDNE